MTQEKCDSGCGCESEEVVSRHRFLEQTTTLSLGALSLTILPGCNDPVTGGESVSGGVLSGQSQGIKRSAGGRPVFGFLVDSEKCVGAGKCMTACRVENKVPEGFHRTWVERYVHLKDGTIQVDKVPEAGYPGSDIPEPDPETVERAYFVPKLCNHCDDAPCNQVCPTHASITSPEGVELVDPEHCIGCSYCVQACPYGVRFINPETETADKCTWCYHRIMRDESPACVEACPVNARIFGRLDDPESEVRKRIAKVPTTVLKAHLGTHPKLRYVGISDEVI